MVNNLSSNCSWKYSLLLLGLISTLACGTLIGQGKNKKTPRIGEVVEVGNFQYQINGISYTQSLGDEEIGTQEKTEGYFLIIDVSITNISKETRNLDGSMFNLFDSRGTKFEHSSRGSTALQLSGGSTVFLDEFQPRIKRTSKLVFEVPSSDDKYKLRLSGGFWSIKYRDILLY